MISTLTPVLESLIFEARQAVTPFDDTTDNKSLRLAIRSIYELGERNGKILLARDILKILGIDANDPLTGTTEIYLCQ